MAHPQSGFWEWADLQHPIPGFISKALDALDNIIMMAHWPIQLYGYGDSWHCSLLCYGP